ncbi:MAG TPA: periplasmic heavy metal sensor [Candidatus Omnitrophota bacterium]|nr:periplasmic heavy metal sensor [Candidatus Omnitrophota bacterium]
MKRFLFGVLSAVMIGSLFIVPATARAGEDVEGRSEKREEMREKWASELGLTAEQKEALKQSKESSKAERDAVRDNLKNARKALMEELKKPVTDKAALDKAVSDVKKAEGDAVDARVKGFLAMKEVLTAEQFQKMSEMKDKWRAEKGEKHYRKNGWKEKENN